MTALQAAVIGSSWTETAVGLLFYILRLVSTWTFVGRARWDLALVTIAVLFACAGQVFLQLSVNNEMGEQIMGLSEKHRAAALFYGWVFQLLSITASMSGKLAILVFLIQIRGRHEKKPWFLLVLAVLITAINVTVMGTLLGQCVPMAKLWNDSIPGSCEPGRRVNQDFSFFQGSFNALADAALASYPVHLFWKLQMRFRLKIALIVLMGMGWIASACSAVKTYQLQVLSRTSNTTYAQPPLLIWVSTEGWIVIIVGCVPPIRPLVDRLFQQLGFTSNRSSNKNPTRVPYTTSRSGRAYISAGRRPEDNSWVELTAVDRKDDMVPRSRVMVVTDIETMYEQD
ncbi:hypothetical protein ASPZODRAFT_20055 [Penicilliopsis zonata CBS 506.65]|uniref:Rhodopsin domain-containing protein n=1 Tax=Penicilliopsis zonata CBS 506.65 TaxID=1073090 RepID=A0A1L9S6K4_9EURO|nr:hypothetical protein ASPZODRAFT_20055 [Penicilliopsis zonata CBS 506.65]OJJ42778.1 hypothetical protein ASPZODRAFT_20055 [Penicilliopsis zonata CBS 506.65]